ncbi:RNA-directed DNA polymerase, eukaryota [Tanacetum coccineum]
MGYSSNSKEDQAWQISNSVFVTNFPDHVLSRDLWKVCSDYGTVIDVYIPLKKSKAGKRFAFVRFIKVVNLDRLIENLCTIWIGRFRLHANVVRFHRGPKPSVWKPKEKFSNHAGVCSWFEVLKPACDSFFCDERIVWISIEGLPLKVWTQNTFNKIASKWGKLVEVEDYGVSSFSHKRLCLRTKFVDLIGERFKVIVQGRLYWIRVKELEVWVPDFHDKKYDSSSSDGEQFDEDDSQVSGTEKQDKVNNDDNEVDRVSETSFGYEQESMHGNLNKLPVDEVHSEDPFKIYDILEKKKENADHPEIADNNMAPGISNDTSQRCKNLFSKVQNGGSFLDVMDELVKVGQTMGYNMEGCMNNIEAIIGSQGDETKMESIDLFSINSLWGNFSFDHAISSSVLGFLHPPNYLLFLVYAPQELSQKKQLWEYLSSLVNRWDGESVLLGDFNETNGMVLLKKKLQMLKEDIKLWSKEVRKRSSDAKLSIQKKISDVDKVLDQGGYSEDNVKYRSSLLKDLQDINSIEASDIAQKAKVRWSIEADENSKYFHGILNKKRSQLVIRGVLADGEWIDDPEWDASNINTIVNVLKCFNMASGLRINIHKSKLMGIGVHSDEVYNTARIVGCYTFSTPFNYLGVKVGGTMSKFSSWHEVISKVKSRLSKWKHSSLSIGGHLTLLKSVISSIPLYHMSIFKVPLGVINHLESIRINFFNGVDGSNKKMVWISWKKVLMSKKKVVSA